MKKVALALSLFLVPSLAFAQSLGRIETLVESISRIVDLATPIIVGIALLGFFWGLARFIFAAGNEEAKGQGKNIMIWGIIALFVMVSVWGIVRFIGQTLDIEQGGTVTPPTVNF